MQLIQCIELLHVLRLLTLLLDQGLLVHKLLCKYPLSELLLLEEVMVLL